MLVTQHSSSSRGINGVATETQRVGAHAAAMAALNPIQYDPLEPTQVMAGCRATIWETAAPLGSSLLY